MIYEVRNYHYDPAKFDAYRKWATNEAIPFLKANLDVVGFWLDSGIDPEIAGSAPLGVPPANVTWVIRWDSMEARAEGRVRVFKGEGWRAVWAKHPDPNGYIQTEAKFMQGA